eukprot:SAG31_NODE_1423_length_8400_cov_2.665944_8_plen_92_part_00
MSDGGALTLVNVALPLATAMGGLSGAGSRLIFDAVTIVEHPELPPLTGTVTSTGVAGELPVVDPPDLLDLYGIVVSISTPTSQRQHFLTRQ